MNYAEMSDFEISCAVLSVVEPGINNMCLSDDKTCFYDCGPSGDGWNQIDIPDYCGDPTDSLPVIIDNLISIRPVGEDGCLWEASGDKGTKADYDKNPLRAAMVVFLMMKEC